MVLLRDIPSGRNDDSKFGGRHHYSDKLLEYVKLMQGLPRGSAAGDLYRPKNTTAVTMAASTVMVGRERIFHNEIDASGVKAARDFAQKRAIALAAARPRL